MPDVIARTDSLMASLGLEVYRVGGSVRDELLGRPAKDADYMVRGVSLSRLGLVLADHNLGFKMLTDRDNRPLGYRLKRGGVEITLPRKEISTGPGHRDFDIVLDPYLSLAEDAKRRDFTFNALYKIVAYEHGPADHPDDLDIIDPTECGLYDLQHKLIRTTHVDSFRDDSLRILRALRFVSTLGYDLTATAKCEMIDHADAVDGLRESGHLSGTVFEEFSKLLMGEFPHRALNQAAVTGVLGNVFPELSPMIGFDQGSRYHDLTTDEHTFKALETAAHVDAPLRVRWALLFHDAGKPETAWRGKDGRLHYYKQFPELERASVMHAPGTALFNRDHQDQGERLWLKAANRMNVPRDLRRDVATLIRNHMVACSSGIKWSKVAKERIAFGDNMLRDLYLHRMCDLTGKGRANASHMANVAAAEKLRQRMVDEGVPKTAKDLEVNGRDATELGLAGRWIGGALSVLLFDVAVDPTPLKRSRVWQLQQLERAAQHRAGIDRAIEESA